MTAWLDIDFQRAFHRGPTIAPRIGPDDGCERHPITVLFGPSGAGKTTVLRCLAGLDRPGRGRIAIDGQTWFDGAAGINTPPQRRRTGYVPQEPSLFPHLSCARNAAYGLRRREGGAGRARDMLDFVGLGPFADRRPGALSGGQRQKLALARALAPRPALLLLDEPLSSLDGPVRESLRDELRALIVRARAPAIIVTHDLHEAAAIADQIIVMTDGLVRQVGPTARVLQRPRTAAVAAAVGFENILSVRIQSTSGTSSTVLVGNSSLEAANEHRITGDALLCVRAADITIGAEPSADAVGGNRLTGRITALRPGMPLDQAVIDCGVTFRAALPRPHSAPLQPGTIVSVSFDQSRAILVPRE